jgi:hypothetical protein
MITRRSRRNEDSHHQRLPNGKAGPRVRSSDGKHYISLEDLLTYPALVHERILPEFKKIHVMRWGQVVLVVSLPQATELADVS